jgi:hypothetical protein
MQFQNYLCRASTAFTEPSKRCQLPANSTGVNGAPGAAGVTGTMGPRHNGLVGISSGMIGHQSYFTELTDAYTMVASGNAVGNFFATVEASVPGDAYVVSTNLGFKVYARLKSGSSSGVVHLLYMN